MLRQLKYPEAGTIITNGSVGIALFKEVAMERTAGLGVSIRFRTDGRMPVGIGKSYDFASDKPSIGRKYPILIGTGGLKRGAHVSELLLTKGVMASCHEVYHIKQFMDEQTVVSDMMVVQSLNHLSSLCNPAHYNENYAQNLREMKAENDALGETKQYLTKAFGEEEAEKLLLEYIAWRTLPDEVRDGPDDTKTHEVYPKYFIPPAGTKDGYYESYADVENAFKDAMSREYPGQYCTRATVVPAEGYKLRDEFVRVVEPLGPKGPWSGIFDKFQSAESQIDSYRMLASLTCYLHPDYKGSFGNLKDVDLSPEAVFGMPFPETREEILDRLAKEEAEVLAKADKPGHGLLGKLFNRSERVISGLDDLSDALPVPERRGTVLEGVDRMMIRETSVALNDGSSRHLIQVSVPDPESVPVPGKKQGYGSFFVNPDAVRLSGEDGKVDISLGDGKDYVLGYMIRTGIDGDGQGTYKKASRTADEVKSLYGTDVQVRKRKAVEVGSERGRGVDYEPEP